MRTADAGDTVMRNPPDDVTAPNRMGPRGRLPARQPCQCDRRQPAITARCATHPYRLHDLDQESALPIGAQARTSGRLASIDRAGQYCVDVRDQRIGADCEPTASTPGDGDPARLASIRRAILTGPPSCDQLPRASATPIAKGLRGSGTKLTGNGTDRRPT